MRTMKLPLCGGRITAGFDQPRPLFRADGSMTSAAERAGQHGAVDLAGGDGLLRALDDGIVIAYVLLHDSKDNRWTAWQDPFWKEKDEIRTSPWPYFYSSHGGLIVLQTKTHTHLFTHFWARELQDRFGKFELHETSKYPERFPAFMMRSEPQAVGKGQVLAKIGNAGFSTADHIHWEVHHKDVLAQGDWELDGFGRIDPTPFIEWEAA